MTSVSTVHLFFMCGGDTGSICHPGKFKVPQPDRWDMYITPKGPFLPLLTFISYSPRGKCMLSHVQLFATPWTVVPQPPLSMEFSTQEYWSRLPFPTPGDRLHPWVEHLSLVLPAFFTIVPLGSRCVVSFLVGLFRHF